MRLKILIILVILGIVLLVSLTVKKWNEIKRQDEVSSSEFSDLKLGLAGFHFIETRSGNPQWELFGQKASVYQGKTAIEGIKCTFFSSSQNVPVLMVEAKKGTLDMETRDIELKEEVKATTQEGTEFTFSTLIWRAKSEIFITPGEIKIIDKKVHISGYGLEIDPERETVKIKEGVKIIISR